MALFTVGHSTHSFDEFVALLRQAKVQHVVDVRTLAGSTRFPHFNEESLRVTLPAELIEYSREKDLGGLRGKTAGVDASTNGLWRNASFHRYADYALGQDFAVALSRVLAEAELRNVVVMCAEAVWWRCHRRIIADYALARGHFVDHIMPDGHLMPASLTLGASVTGEGSVSASVTYPLADS